MVPTSDRHLLHMDKALRGVIVFGTKEAMDANPEP